MTLLHEKVREQSDKKSKWTRLMMADSQAVKNTCNASVELSGGHKCVKGRHSRGCKKKIDRERV